MRSASFSIDDEGLSEKGINLNFSPQKPDVTYTLLIDNILTLKWQVCFYLKFELFKFDFDVL